MIDVAIALRLTAAMITTTRQSQHGWDLAAYLLLQEVSAVTHWEGEPLLEDVTINKFSMLQWMTSHNVHMDSTHWA